MSELLDFFRPHEPVVERLEVVNPWTGEVSVPPTMTKQEFKAECDINNIVKHFQPHEMVSMMQVALASGAYQDLPDNVDYQAAIHLVREAEEAFMTVPSKIRDRFGQDAGQFLAFCSDPNNVVELRELGLANPLPQTPAPVAPSAGPVPAVEAPVAPKA